MEGPNLYWGYAHHNMCTPAKIDVFGDILMGRSGVIVFSRWI